MLNEADPSGTWRVTWYGSHGVDGDTEERGRRFLFPVTRSTTTKNAVIPLGFIFLPCALRSSLELTGDSVATLLFSLRIAKGEGEIVMDTGWSILAYL